MAWGQVTTLVESAENGLATVSIQSSPGYNPFSPNIFADSSPHSFHLAQPDWADQWVRLKTAVTPQAGSVLKFKSRLAWSGSGQTTHVQVSGNGGATWSDVFTQTGSDSAGEQAFSDRTVSLDGFAGQSIQIRFLYVADVNGSTFTASGDSGQFIAGWFIDMIQVFNAGSSVPVLSEGAESGLAGVTIQSSPGYNVFSTKIYADGAMHSFHLAQPDWADQWVRLKTAVIPQAGSVLRFKSRLAWSGSGQTTHVQVSGDGGATWGDVLTQTGTDSAGEQAFSDRTVSLDGFAGQTIQVRFLYVADVNGSTFTASGDSGQFIAGWFIDLITITNVLLSNPTAPVITQQPQSKMAAEGGAVTFTVSASGSGPLNYQWQRNGTPISGATSSALSLSGVQSGTAGNYSVVASNTLGSAASTPAALSVFTITSPEITSQSSVSMSGTVTNPANVGGVAVNGVTVQTTDGYSHWTVPNIPLSDGMNSFVITASATPGISGSWNTVSTWNVFRVTQSNILKFALNPSGAALTPDRLPHSSMQHDPATSADYLTFAYPRRIDAAGLSYVIELSNDLQSWREGTPAEIEETSPPVANPDFITENISVRIHPAIGQSGAAQQFVRLRVIAP